MDIVRAIVLALIVLSIMWAWTTPSTNCGMTGYCTGLSTLGER